MSRTNKFSLWIQLVVGFGFAVLFLHYCCVEAYEQERYSFLFFTFWTCVGVVTLQIIALFVAMTIIALSFMMIYIHRLPGWPVKLVVGAMLFWCNVALLVAMVLTARSANLTAYHSARDLTWRSFFAGFFQREPAPVGDRAGIDAAGQPTATSRRDGPGR